MKWQSLRTPIPFVAIYPGNRRRFVWIVQVLLARRSQGPDFVSGSDIGCASGSSSAAMKPSVRTSCVDSGDCVNTGSKKAVRYTISLGGVRIHIITDAI